MPLARIRTRVPEQAIELAEELFNLGYTVETVGPGEYHITPADVEINLDVCKPGEVFAKLPPNATVYVASGVYLDTTPTQPAHDLQHAAKGEPEPHAREAVSSAREQLVDIYGEPVSTRVSLGAQVIAWCGTIISEVGAWCADIVDGVGTKWSQWRARSADVKADTSVRTTTDLNAHAAANEISAKIAPPGPVIAMSDTASAAIERRGLFPVWDDAEANDTVEEVAQASAIEPQPSVSEERITEPVIDTLAFGAQPLPPVQPVSEPVPDFEPQPAAAASAAEIPLVEPPVVEPQPVESRPTSAPIIDIGTRKPEPEPEPVLAGSVVPSIAAQETVQSPLRPVPPRIRTRHARELEWKLAWAGAAALSLLIVFGLGFAMRRPASPLGLNELFRSATVQQAAPFGSASIPASTTTGTASVPVAPKVTLKRTAVRVSKPVSHPSVKSQKKSNAARRHRRVSDDDDEVVVRHYQATARKTAPNTQQTAKIKRFSDLQ